MNLRKKLRTILFFIFIGPIAHISHAQQTIDLVVPFGPGGPTDGLARTFASIAQVVSSESFIVNNIPGGSGNLALSSIMTSAPNETVGILPIATGQGQRFLEMGFEVAGSVGQTEYALFANRNGTFASGNPFDSLRDSGATIGIPGGASVQSLIGRDIKRDVGDTVVLIPFKNSNESGAALLTSALDFAIAPVSFAASSLDIVPMAVFSAERLPQAPDTPTASELGFDIQRNVEYVFFAPGDIDRGALAKLENTLGTVANSQEFISAVQERGVLTFVGFRSGDTVRSQIESASNDFCTTCNCDDDDDCRLNCTKCDS